ncbi:hypothetical protein [Bittarella massiliensis (ex Durand et al. 2017)]|uniref:hypothetical protein n=1 Tax=Bittarella massiliensis (ex Durand et al. 2017) TaxID=1720313 RepID=UPI001AA11295|nr:hypothetical protein [Bittarella massiliensis (ex Durand et al. 2017)]MBO1679960.1 hypothetical protein [Bittarella massiliensis (ex Durand et al. 2017)]
MAGYVFAIGKTPDPIDTIRTFAERGIYSTYINSLYPLSFEGTLADYLSMRPGDNIYFFCKRKFYGIGELVSVGPDCKYCNFPSAAKREDVTYNDIQDDLLLDEGLKSPKYRWLCTFRGAPHFFESGVDMDEVLTYKPQTFKMLRAFWKVSFIKLGDEENQSLREIFLLRHQEELATHTHVLPENDTAKESLLSKSLTDYIITPHDMLSNCHEGDRVKHEMALEANVVYDLCQDRIPELGHWDYVSHQVIASPFKPVDYMDKIDVFAVRYLPGTSVPCKYLVVELKKDIADADAIDQVLKYVDWVCKEYAYGDYSAIEACIITAGTPSIVQQHYLDVVQRNYALGSHPIRNEQWNALKLLRYSYQDGTINYYDETPET